MAWPWISREHHAEVVAAKDAIIDWLGSQNDALRERLAQPVAVTVQLPEGFALIQPAIVRSPRAQQQDSKPINWANVDENDAEEMALLAAREFGRRVSPDTLSRWTIAAKIKIRAARRDKKAEAALQSGVVGIAGEQPESAESPVKEVSAYVPAAVREMIANAERV
jgi:hypothetical protein